MILLDWAPSEARPLPMGYGRLQLNGSREQKIILKVDVLMQILLELAQTLIECAECGAGTVGRCVGLA